MSDQVMAEYTQVLGLHVLAGLIFSSSSFTIRIQTDCLFPLSFPQVPSQCKEFPQLTIPFKKAKQ